VQINWIDPDFDPKIIPKFKRDYDRTMEIRMMLPFSMQCNTCGEFMYKGKKFNSKKEEAKGEAYMGIRRFRFYIKCVMCNAEISFKTDPKNTDYECESGATRTFEVWRETAEKQEEVVQQREEEDELDNMKALENRTLDSKIEMDVLDALEEIKSINHRHERVDTEKVLQALHSRHKKTAETEIETTVGAGVGEEAKTSNKSSTNSGAILNQSGLTAEDEALVKSIKFGSKSSKRVIDGSDALSSSTTATTNDDKNTSSSNPTTTGVVNLLRKQLLSGAPSANTNTSTSVAAATAASAAAALTTNASTAIPKTTIIRKRKVNESSSHTSSHISTNGKKTCMDTKQEKQMAPSSTSSATTVASTVANPVPMSNEITTKPTGVAGMFADYGDDSD